MKPLLEALKQAADTAEPIAKDPQGVDPFPPGSDQAARFDRELARLKAAESLTFRPNVPITPYVSKPHRVNGTSAPCLLPIRVVVTIDGHPEFRVKRCMRWRCKGCRPFKEAEMAERISRAFDSQSAYIEDVDLKTWESTKKRLNRRGAEYCRIPTNRPGVVTVLSTSPPTEAAVPVHDLEALLADVLAKRPKSRGGGRISSSRGFLPKEEAVNDDPLATGEAMGTWDHRVTLSMLEEMCTKIGVPFERHRPAKPTQTDRLTILTDWDDPGFVQVRRWCGFAYPDQTLETLETSDDWMTWLMGEDVPWNEYVEMSA